MEKNSEKKGILVLVVIMGVVFIAATILVIVLGMNSKAESYQILLTLSPIIIGAITGYIFLNSSYSEEE